MKKKMLVIMVVLAVIVALAACGRPQKMATCAECFQEKMCREYMVTDWSDRTEPMMICDDCIETSRAIAKTFGMTIE